MLLREMAREGHRPIVLTSNSNHLVSGPKVTGTHLTRSIEGVEVCWLRTRKYTGAKSIGRVLSWIDFEWRVCRTTKNKFPKPDVIIASSLSLLSIISGLILRRRYACRLIFEVRDIWPLSIVEEGGFSPRNPFVAALAWIERLAYRRSDVIVGTMPNLQEHVEEVAGAGAAPVRCIPMGVDREQVDGNQSLSDDYVANYFPQNKFIVCHAGTIGITNALDTLFDCARMMRDCEAVHFLIVGDGDLKAHYQGRYAELQNLSFAPSVPKAQVQSVLAQCDLLYFSTHASKVWRFGQSLNKVIDYMLAGKPIVASYSGFPSMIDESGAGVFVPAGDSHALKCEIKRFAMMGAEERARIGAKARAWVLEKRTYARLASDYLAIALPQADEGSVPEV